ncbi:hypothetical protein Q757_01535 [Oenococcus alcoholitolerans]|uniref:Uncharacterized protein n=1 Tax=Oenococcus alcoholitolerans TaxID=931074 RepID=A0ABR4XS88_9LACO|nr:hypothetical protein Q757_01535 [Oenococcus alcoholitolerans]
MSELNQIVGDQDYEFGFHDDVKPFFSTGKGLNEEIIKRISKEKTNRIGC